MAGVSALYLILSFIIKIPVLNASSVTLIKSHILQCLIWVFTIFQCPFYGMPGINRLNLKHSSR